VGKVHSIEEGQAAGRRNLHLRSVRHASRFSDRRLFSRGNREWQIASDQGVTQRCNDFVKNIDAPEIPALCRDERPRCVCRAGEGQHLLGYLQGAPVAELLAPVRLLQPPALVAVSRDICQAPLLLLLGRLQPEFQEHGTIVG